MFILYTDDGRCWLYRNSSWRNYEKKLLDMSRRKLHVDMIRGGLSDRTFK